MKSVFFVCCLWMDRTPHQHHKQNMMLLMMMISIGYLNRTSKAISMVLLLWLLVVLVTFCKHLRLPDRFLVTATKRSKAVLVIIICKEREKLSVRPGRRNVYEPPPLESAGNPFSQPPNFPSTMPVVSIHFRQAFLLPPTHLLTQSLLWNFLSSVPDDSVQSFDCEL